VKTWKVPEKRIIENLPENWDRLGKRFVEIEKDDSLPADYEGLDKIKTELDFQACENIIGTRNVNKLRAMLFDMGFTGRAALGQFRDYYMSIS
jgi:hypothetical protein